MDWVIEGSVGKTRELVLTWFDPGFIINGVGCVVLGLGNWARQVRVV